jgi:hypothetical protein
MFGGTVSIIYGFCDSLVTCMTTSDCSPSGKHGNSILDLSVFIGHFITLQEKGNLSSLA